MTEEIYGEYHLQNPSLHSSKKKLKILLSTLKISKQGKNHRGPLVKCRKSYCSWTLSICSSPGERRGLGDSLSFFFLISQHQVEMKGRSQSRKKRESLKGKPLPFSPACPKS